MNKLAGNILPSQVFPRLIEATSCGIDAGLGPFGAAIIHPEEGLVATGFNRVVEMRDPTAHAEIEAIRMACSMLGTHRLDGCAIYCTCEPCPMCFGAIHWARMSRIYYACTREDANWAGFSDADIYTELEKRCNFDAGIAMPPKIPMEQFFQDDARRIFAKWKLMSNKIAY